MTSFSDQGIAAPGSPPQPSETTVEMIRRLVGFKTVSHESNLDLIEWMRDWLNDHGAVCRLTYDGEKRKANLFATIGECEQPGVVLSGHTDVVPVVDQPWETDPFQAVVRDGRIYGRGTTDMKSFIAVCLTAAPRFASAPLKMPVHFAFSYDEEVGCLGVRGLLDDLARNQIRPAGCIVGEPSGMRVIIAHKGKRSYRCCVRGQEAHSSVTPLGVNAIECAAEIIMYIREMAERARRSEQRQEGFDVPFTTLLTTVIRGGMSFNNTNTIPGDCEFIFEYRYLPGVNPEQIISEIRDYAYSEILPAMRAVSQNSDIRFELKLSYPGLNTEEQAAIAELARQLAPHGDFGKVAFGAEAGLFQQAGIPSIICGPGDIRQAHRTNEFITLEQVALCEQFIDRLIDQMCRGQSVGAKQAHMPETLGERSSGPIHATTDELASRST